MSVRVIAGTTSSVCSINHHPPPSRADVMHRWRQMMGPLGKKTDAKGAYIKKVWGLTWTLPGLHFSGAWAPRPE